MSTTVHPRGARRRKKALYRRWRLFLSSLLLCTSSYKCLVVGVALYCGRRNIGQVLKILRKKKDLPDTMSSLVDKWRKGGMNIKIIRLDNAGENKAFEEHSNGKDWCLNLTFEFMGPDIPQQNHLAEVGFSTLWGCVRAIMHQAMVPEEKEHLLYQEAISYAARLD